MHTNGFSHFCPPLGLARDSSTQQNSSCLSGEKTFDGFIQELKWEEEQHEELGMASDHESSGKPGEQKTTFKFVTGRAKRKRRSRSRKAGEYDGYSHQFRISSSSGHPLESNADPEGQTLETNAVGADRQHGGGSPRTEKRGSTFADAWSLSSPLLMEKTSPQNEDRHQESFEICMFRLVRVVASRAEGLTDNLR